MLEGIFSDADMLIGSTWGTGISRYREAFHLLGAHPYCMRLRCSWGVPYIYFHGRVGIKANCFRILVQCLLPYETTADEKMLRYTPHARFTHLSSD